MVNATKHRQQPAKRVSLVAAILAAISIATIAVSWKLGTDRKQHEAFTKSAEGPTRLSTSTSTAAHGTTASNEQFTIAHQEIQADWKQIDDPQNDGWTTEATTQDVLTALNKIGQFLVDPTSNSDTLRETVGNEFVCGTVQASNWNTIFEDDSVCIQREARSATKKPVAAETGIGALSTALKNLQASFEGASNVRFKFKIVEVTQDGNEFQSRQLFTITGRQPDGILQHKSTWISHWHLSQQGMLPKLMKLAAVDFEHVKTKQAQPWFADCTKSVLAENASYHQQLSYGLNHWLERIQDTRYFSPLGNPGLACGDVNGDGLDDLYICQESGLPNKLFLQRPDGKAIDASADWGVDWLDSSRGVLLIDLDNDGDQDLVVATLGGVILASNEQQAGFSVRTMLPTDDDVMTLCAADYDNDGDLDIYACVNYPNDFFAESADISVLGGASNRVYHDSNNAGRNALFRNDSSRNGQWKFTNVTDDVGLDVNNRRFSLAAAWGDIDDDGDQDLYVGNDFGRNNLFLNEQTGDGQPSRFTDIAKRSETEDSASGMSVSWADVNRDGRLDLYVGNMFSAAGSRITSQPQFKAEADKRTRNRLQRFSRGNSLFTNDGNHAFTDASLIAGVQLGRWAWSSNFLDINNDGWQDIIVANGYITTEDNGDL